MDSNHSLTDLLRRATYEDDMDEDDVAMAEVSSHHDEDTPSDQTVSTPSDAGPDGPCDHASNKKTAASKKRKHPGVTTDGNPKPVKKRASQACEICRSRKVRCDSEKRHPCTNCADMGLVCHIPESKRRRRHLHAPASTHSILPNPTPTIATTFSQSAVEEPALHAGDSPVGMSRRSSQLYRTYGGGPSAQDQWGPNEETQAWRAVVPQFVKPPTPGKVSSEGLRYLQYMGALDLPNRALEKQLLLAYIEHVHPDFPVLELHDFLRRASDRSGRQGQVSLLLYQSVMFAASAFVKSEHLSAAGFSNRRALRRSTFQAAKLLHDFDYENDKFTLVQSSLLLSFWYEAPDDSKETWHWSGIAISQAQALGLHRSTVNSSQMDPAKRRQRRRIWWSCVMRDRQIGLGMSRLIRIKDEDFDIPELREDDFEVENLDDNPLITPEDCPLMYDVGLQQELAEMCVYKAKLYVMVGHVLQAVQSFQVATSNRMRSVSAIIEGNLELFEAVHRELVAWAAALPPACQYRKLARSDTQQGRTPVAMQRSLLHMLYQTTIGKVYHPLVRPPRSAIADDSPAQQISHIARQKCKETAVEITRMAGEMHEFGLDRFFPTTGVTVIMPAMLMHLQDVSDPVKETRDEAHRGFDTCMSVLNTLRETYAAAEYAAIFMDNVIRNKPGLERPAPVPASKTATSANQAPAATGQAMTGQMMTAMNASRGTAYTPLMPREMGADLGQRSHNALHPGLNEMGLANLPVMSQSPMGPGLTSQTMQMTSVDATFPETTALLTALEPTSSSAPDPWPVEMISRHASEGSGSMSPENSSAGYSFVSGGNVSQGTDLTVPCDLSAETFGLAPGNISAEGLNFPQLADDGWQNWLNLPPETELSGDGWTGAQEHIDPGTLNPTGPEIFG